MRWKWVMIQFRVSTYNGNMNKLVGPMSHFYKDIATLAQFSPAASKDPCPWANQVFFSLRRRMRTYPIRLSSPCLFVVYTETVKSHQHLDRSERVWSVENIMVWKFQTAMTQLWHNSWIRSSELILKAFVSSANVRVTGKAVNFKWMCLGHSNWWTCTFLDLNTDVWSAFCMISR